MGIGFRQRGCGLVVLVVAACAGGADERHVTGTLTTFGSSTNPTSATDGAETGTGDTDASGSSDGVQTSSGPADTTGDIGPTYVVRGTVIDFGTLDMPPAADATVSLANDASISTTTDAAGAFELAVPAGDIAFVEVTLAGYWGAIVRADARDGDVELGEIDIANDTFIEVKVAPFANFDLGKGALIGRSTATDTTLTLLENGMPATATDEYFSIDAQINFTLGDNVTRSAGFPAVVFFNLDDGGAGGLTMSASHPMLSCAVAGPTPPVKATQITWVEIACS